MVGKLSPKSLEVGLCVYTYLWGFKDYSKRGVLESGEGFCMHAWEKGAPVHCAASMIPVLYSIVFRPKQISTSSAVFFLKKK